ncbi:MAG: 1-hydroxycarotenoid 3,4-desaturase CrtD [Cytophagales bacterium]
MNTNKKAVVIGAGIAGIAAAIRLRKLGFEVVVFESAATYGGKIKEYLWNGFRFDTGPSLFTLPELVDELFELCDKNPRDYYTYKTLKSITRYFYEDGIVINSYSNPIEFANEVVEKTKVDSNVVLSFLKKQAKTYRLLAPIFLENPIHIIGKLLKISNIPALIHVANPSFLLSMNKVNAAWFKNKYLVRLFNRYGTYNGSNPYTMPSLFNIISHLEHNVGAYLPEKGIRSIADSLYKLAMEEGVVFQFNSFVDNINVNHKKTDGIKAKGIDYQADIVVSNMDVNNTYSQLLGQTNAPKMYLQNQKSTSALIFHWAVKGNFEALDVHNILFAKNYEEEFEYLFHKMEMYHDPTIYIYISSKTVANDAPVGFENWFVMVNTPHLGDFNLDVEATRKSIQNKIKNYLKIDIEPLIQNENTITPTDLQNTTHSFLGSLYGASSNNMMSAFLRHPNFSKVENLYFCGGTVHPGGGIPLSLMSAKIVASLVQESIEKQ